MAKNPFKSHHINATPADLAGNHGIGRYIFLPGSDGRAKEIAHHFENTLVKQHHRGHNLYLGTLDCSGKKIDVAAVSSGMGCPSTEIIVHELFNLGAKRFLRIGTAGSLQPDWVKTGSIINVHASVRDESTSQNYAPVELPAVASLEVVSSILLAAGNIGLSDQVHTGTVHCKSSLYAREFSMGPKAIEHKNYLDLLSQFGVLGSEMETAILFIQSQLYNHQLMQQGEGPQHRVLSGAILGVIGQMEETTEAHDAVNHAIDLALETVKILASQEVVD